jgi:hypothetical protein
MKKFFLVILILSYFSLSGCYKERFVYFNDFGPEALYMRLEWLIGKQTVDAKITKRGFERELLVEGNKNERYPAVIYFRCEKADLGTKVVIGSDDSDLLKFENIYGYIARYLNKPLPGPGSVEYVPVPGGGPPSPDDFYNDDFFDYYSESGSGG